MLDSNRSVDRSIRTAVVLQLNDRSMSTISDSTRSMRS